MFQHIVSPDDIQRDKLNGQPQIPKSQKQQKYDYFNLFDKCNILSTAIRLVAGGSHLPVVQLLVQLPVQLVVQLPVQLVNPGLEGADLVEELCICKNICVFASIVFVILSILFVGGHQCTFHWKWYIRQLYLHLYCI